MSVLIDSSIRSNFSTIFRSGGSEENIRAAKYYLTLGEDLLFLPGGDNYPPGTRRKRPFTLSPGQSATVSTKERVYVPNDMIGIIGSRFENSERGLLFFGGMIVDPGYGQAKDETTGEVKGEPLFVTIANLGDLPIELRPGEDFIASIAFLELEEPIDEQRVAGYHVARPAIAKEDEMHGDDMAGRGSRPLGFVEELEEMKAELNRTSVLASQVVLFGVIVLSVTLCAAVLSATFEASGHFEAKESLARSLGLTLGVIFAAVVLASGLFYIWVRAVAYRKNVNRLVNLSRSKS